MYQNELAQNIMSEALPTQGSQPAKETNTSTPWLLSILIFVCIRFSPTIIFGQSISKIFLLPHWDSMFFPLRQGPNFGMDPTVVQMYLPYRFFVAEAWRHGIPLWNSLSGFGMPLLADPQSFVLSPLFLLCNLFPCMYAWNLTLVLELLIGAVSTYFFCIELEFSVFAAALAAMVFIFCPWVQWLQELYGNGICLTPFVCLFFVRAAKQQALLPAAWAGVASAICILSAHPENSFVSIVFGVILMFLVARIHENDGFRFLNFVARIGVAAAVAFGLSAPLLIPFAEYVLNGQTYKLETLSGGVMPLEGLFAHFCYPFYSVNSPYWGPLAWIGLPAAILVAWKANRFIRPLLLCFAVAILAITKVFPVNYLALVPPLSLILPIYIFAAYVLFAAVLIAGGLDHILKSLQADKRLPWSACVVGLILSVMALIYLPWHRSSPAIHIDPTLAPPHFTWKLWLASFICVAPIVVSFLAKTRQRKLLAFWSFIALGLVNLLAISYFSLPPRPSFDYPDKLPVNLDVPQNQRLLSIGNHLFRPTTNLVYGIPQIQGVNPLFPRGFTDFMRASGAAVDEWNQIFPITVSRLVDLTGARRILSEEPILDGEKYGQGPHSPDINGMFSNSIELGHIQLFFDRGANALLWRYNAKPLKLACPEQYIYFSVTDDKDRALAFIEPKVISGMQQQVYEGSVVLPAGKKRWKLTVSMRDLNGHLLKPNTISVGSLLPGGSWLFADSDSQNLFTLVTNDRFRLVRKTGSFLLYENQTALNRYLWVKSPLWFSQREDVLSYLKQHPSYLKTIAAMEDSQKAEFENMLAKISRPGVSGPTGSFDQSGTISTAGGLTSSSGSALSSEVMVQTKAPGLLLMSDLYYPGWKVFLDGAEWKIFRADYLVRVVLVPPGKHHIRFVYEPQSFKIGIVLFLITVGSLCAAVFRRRRITLAIKALS